MEMKHTRFLFTHQHVDILENRTVEHGELKFCTRLEESKTSDCHKFTHILYKFSTVITCSTFWTINHIFLAV